MLIDPKQWPTLSKLLDEALDVPPEDRDRWLESLPQETVAYKDALRSLLRHAGTAETRDFLDVFPNLQEAVAEVRAATHVAMLTPGTAVGPYVIERQIGSGGMGAVWLARRRDGVIKRPVALKLPHAGPPGGQLADRFIGERNILAELAHPNIARLYDAGFSADGQPYLALEYVAGEPLTAYCDEHCLDIRQRLRLFQQVLRAVQYAHGNLVIHRDLKPSNVIVGHDGRAMLLDFGIAKLIAAETADDNPRTQAGAAAAALTLEYASPEQICGPPITTASDIYSLGVLLFELLTGGCPYRLGRTTRAALEEAILTLDPLRPSQSVLAAAAARARASTVSGLSKALRGDLDTIVLKAMKKLPADRYSTADALSEDIERYLAGEPVTARKDRGWYHTSKFISRHRISFIGAGVALAAVFATAAIAISQARSAAIHARAAAAERDRALALSARNAAVGEFLHILITEAARSNKPIAAADLITRSETIVNKEYRDSPEVRAAVLDALSGYYWSLVSHGAGNPRAALALLDETLRLAAENEPDAPPEPTFLYNRAVLLEDLGRYRESRDTYLRCTAESRRTGAAQITADCFVGLASVSQELADPVSAGSYLAAASANLDPAASPDSNAMIRLRIVKGSIALTAGRLEEARADLEAVIAASKNVYRTMRALLIRAELNLNVGMETAAEADARRVLELARTAQGSAAYSNYTGRSWLILGRVLHRRGDQVGAGKAFQAAVENLSNTVDADHPKLLLARHLADDGR